MNFFGNRVVGFCNKLSNGLMGLCDIETFKNLLDAKWDEMFPKVEV